MAIMQPMTDYNDYRVKTTGKEFPVGGKMLAVQRVAHDAVQMNMSAAEYEHHIKAELAQDIAIALIENKLIEFTKENDLSRMQTIYRARVFCTPDETVRVLRLAQVLK